MKPAPFLPLLAALSVFSFVSTSSAAWVRLPNDAVKPVNLAADRIPNTSITSSKGINQANNLINEDPSKPAQIPTGKSSAVLSLNSQQNIELIAFSNGGVAGVLNVQGSTDNESWIDLTQLNFASNEAAVSARFSPIQVRYIRLEFNSASSGFINNISLVGAASSAPASSAPSQSDSPSNIACAIGGARPIYANPTPVNLNSLEFDVNIFRFPQSKQPAKTVIYDLGSPQAVNDVSLAYDLRPTRIDIFAFDQLPEKKDWRGKLTLDPTFLDEATPAAVGVDSKGIGRIKIRPDAPINTQYVIIRLQPLSQNTGIGSVIEGIAAHFGFETPQSIATPPGGSTISSIFINAPFSSSAYRNALASALSGQPTDIPQGQGNDNTLSSFDKADSTPLIPPSFLGQYDYRMNGGIGGGGNNTGSSAPSQPAPVVNNIIRTGGTTVVEAPGQSLIDP